MWPCCMCRHKPHEAVLHSKPRKNGTLAWRQAPSGCSFLHHLECESDCGDAAALVSDRKYGEKHRSVRARSFRVATFSLRGGLCRRDMRRDDESLGDARHENFDVESSLHGGCWLSLFSLRTELSPSFSLSCWYVKFLCAQRRFRLYPGSHVQPSLS